MRIIAGEFKGRGLIGPKSIRPTENKVKEALFDILRNVVCNCRFLDLYAGSGAVGIEALSRGANQAYFVESDSKNCAIIKENLDKIRVDKGFYEILSMDAQDAILKLHKQAEKFDLIFLDPPYYEALAKKTLQILEAYDILARNGFIIVQHHRKDSPLGEFAKLKLWRTNSYSTTRLSFYCKTTNLYIE